MVSSLGNPLVQNQLVVRLNFGEEHTHPRILPSMNHLSESIEVLTSLAKAC
jgi:hypothetical protein